MCVDYCRDYQCRLRTSHIVDTFLTMSGRNTTSQGRGRQNQRASHSNNGSSGRKSNTHTGGRGPNKKPAVPMSGVPYGYLPAFLPGSASLVEQLDRRLMIVLRDGRHLVGVSYKCHGSSSRLPGFGRHSFFSSMQTTFISFFHSSFIAKL
jgi:hypothetical protein